MLSADELNILRKLAPRSRSGAFLCEEYPEYIKNKGITLSVRLDYKLLDEELEFPDCASWRIAAFNFESGSYQHEGFSGTFAELLQKTKDDFMKVAGNYGPKAREVIMKSVYDIEMFLCGRHDLDCEKKNELPRPILFRIRDPSGLTKTSIFRSSCMQVLNQLRINEVEYYHSQQQKQKQKQKDDNEDDDDENDDDKGDNDQCSDEKETYTLHEKINTHLSKLHPIYQRTFYERTWEEDKNLGLFNHCIDFNQNRNELTDDGDQDDADEHLLLPYTTAAQIAKLIKKSKRICLLSGAGISVESGIRPFRTSVEEGKAIWKDFDATKMTSENFNTDDTITSHWWKMKRNLYKEIHNAKPNPAHKFFGLLHRLRKLRGVITQNIDSLHLAGGVPREKLVELHGHMRTLHCSDRQSEHNNHPIKKGTCDFIARDPFRENRELLDDIGRLNDEDILMKITTMQNEKKEEDDYYFEDIDQEKNHQTRYHFLNSNGAGDEIDQVRTSENNINGKDEKTWTHLKNEVPLCPKCACPLRTPTIMFNQGLPPSAWDRARRLIGSRQNKSAPTVNKKRGDGVSENHEDDNENFCDLLLVVGTTLIVAPANQLPGQCLKNGVPIVIVNLQDSSMYDRYAHGLVREPAGQFFAEVAKEMGEIL